MKTIHLAQPNHLFGNNAFLPYSVGCLWAAAEPHVQGAFKLARPIQFMREPVEEVAATKPDVLALSCYIWNWEYCLALAAAVKKANPECTVIFGGPQVPDVDRGAFALLDAAPVDILIHGEGEKAFSNVLESLARGTTISMIPGVTNALGSWPAQRATSLEDFPSPYTAGVFDDLMKLPFDWHASWETHRGCPYSCTFCDWGSAVQQKVTSIGTSRLNDEMEWFSDSKIDLLYNCDANFGMLPRDRDIIDQLITTKDASGFPQKLRAAYPKIHSPRIIQQNIDLHEAGLCKGVTVSMQSLDPEVLTAIKRKNISPDNLPELFSTYKAKGVPTYTELILGLPGETLDSFKAGIELLLRAGQHDGLSIYPCMVLPNSELADPEYVERWGIKTNEVHQLLLHGTRSKGDIAEKYNVIVETNTMPHNDWRRAMLFSMVVQALHCMGLTRIIALSMGNKMSFDEFYTAILENHSPYRTRFGLTLQFIYKALVRWVQGGPVTSRIEGYGEVEWPMEERIFLFMREHHAEFLDDLELVFGPIDPAVKQMQLEAMTGPEDFNGDTEAWSRECVWYGRKAGGTMR